MVVLGREDLPALSRGGELERAGTFLARLTHAVSKRAPGNRHSEEVVLMLLWILILLLLFGGGGGYYAYGPMGGVSIGGIILIVPVVMLLTGRL
jgi:hypothetical protein